MATGPELAIGPTLEKSALALSIREDNDTGLSATLAPFLSAKANKDALASSKAMFWELL
jgi:hypothetical protein